MSLIFVVLAFFLSPLRVQCLPRPMCGVEPHLGSGVSAGLNNQKTQFLGLVMLARNWGFDVSLDSLRWRADWKTSDLVNHTQIWNIAVWNHEERLPKILPGKPTKTWHPDELWQHYQRNSGMFDYNVQHPHYETKRLALGRLQPQPWIVSLARHSAPPPPYGALHARVENDLSLVSEMAGASVGLEEIYRLMQAVDFSNVSTAWPPKSLFIAVSNDVNNETKALLDEGVTPWSGTKMVRAGVQVVPTTTAQYLVASIIDFEICTKAEWFVGTGMSTFSNMITTARVMRNETANFFYNHGGIFPRSDDGRLNWELQ